MTVEIRIATVEDAPGIRRLFAKVFGAELTAQEWEWKFRLDPDGWFGVVAVLEGEIVGNYAGWGMRFQAEGGETSLLYSVGDVATDPSTRGMGGRRGIYRRMVEAFYEAVFSSGTPLCFGFPNARALQISNRLAGTRTLFPIREVHLECESFGPPPAGAAAGDFVSEPFDELWREASRRLTFAAVRDRARANWRFHARPTRYYRMVWLESSGRMEGWAVLSVVGGRALLADYLASETGRGSLDGVLAAAAAEARRLGARTLVVWETPGGPWSEEIRALRGQRQDAGFPIALRAHDEDFAARFASRVHFTPALYDVV